MGLFSSKIFAGVLAGGVTLGAAGLLFTGTDTLQKASDFVGNAGERIAQYELNEIALLEKLGLVKEDASAKIEDAKVNIAILETDIAALEKFKSELETTVEGLNTEIEELSNGIAQLEEYLANEVGNHEATKTALGELQTNYDNKVTELANVQAELDTAATNLANITEERNTLQETLEYALAKASEGDKLVEQLEGEIEKANTEVEAHGEVVDQVEAEVVDDQPLTQEEIDAIDTTVEGVEPVTPLSEK